ncbi:MAG: hypothetical protein ABIJ41_00240 [Candidatus Omnitrophota bacterium]
MMNKILIGLLIFLGVIVSSVLAQEASERLTQEEFACEMIKTMNLDSRLPLAALPGDCVDVLEGFGIAPMTGWDNKAYLSQEDYLVILSKAEGKEAMLYKTANAVEKKNAEVINQKWQESYQKTKKWMSLSELMEDKNYFPKGAPKSPFGVRYRDRNNDHKVDEPFLPIVGLIEMRELLSYPIQK